MLIMTATNTTSTKSAEGTKSTESAESTESAAGRAVSAGERVDLTGVSETMLLPLHARAEHTLSARPRFEDWTAVDLVSRLDYDFSEAARDRLMSGGVVMRTLTFDSLVSGFILTHPETTVVNIACGLDTRLHRLDNGRLTWYDLDLPDVIDLRRQLLGEGERRHMIAASALDPDWPEQVRAAGDVLVIIEGLTMYLTQDEVAALMDLIATRLPGATVLIEVMPHFFQKVRARALGGGHRCPLHLWMLGRRGVLQHRRPGLEGSPRRHLR